MGISFGLFLAGLTAVLESFKDLVSKKAAVEKKDGYHMALALSLFSLPIIYVAALFQGLPDSLNSTFWLAVCSKGVLGAMVAVLFMWALKLSHLSSVIALVAFTPVFMLVTTPIMVSGEPSVSFVGVAGIICIVGGAYMLYIRQKGGKPLDPFRALWKENGAKLMLGVSVLWSITANLDKIGVNNGTPVAYLVFSQTLSVLLLMVVVVLRHGSREAFEVFVRNTEKLVPIGVTNGFVLMAHMFAVLHAPVIYVIAIKRMSMVFSTLVGVFVFKESFSAIRFLGAFIMFLGALLIMFWG